MAKYNYESVNTPYLNHSTISSAFISDLKTLREAIQRIIQNTSGLDSPGMTSIKQFLCDVPIGAIEALQLGMEEFNTVYVELLKMANTQIDTSDMANISNEGLTAIWDFSLVRSNFLETKTLEINNLLSSLAELDIFVTKLPTGDASALHNSVFKKVKTIEDGILEVNKVNSVETLTTFFDNISHFVNFLGSCINTENGKAQYDRSTLTSQPWYQKYAEKAISILAGYEDDYFINMNNSDVMTLVEKERLGQIFIEIFETGDTDRLHRLIHMPNSHKSKVFYPDVLAVDRLRAYAQILNELAEFERYENGVKDWDLYMKYKNMANICGIIVGLYNQYSDRAPFTGISLEFTGNGLLYMEMRFTGNYGYYSIPAIFSTSSRDGANDMEIRALTYAYAKELDKNIPDYKKKGSGAVVMGGSMMALKKVPYAGAIIAIVEFAAYDYNNPDTSAQIDAFLAEVGLSTLVNSYKMRANITIFIGDGGVPMIQYEMYATTDTEIYMRNLNTLLPEADRVSFSDIEEGNFEKLRNAEKEARLEFNRQYKGSTFDGARDRAYDAYLLR